MHPSSSAKKPKKYLKPRRIGPYSKAGALARLDGRSPHAQYMKRVRGQLVAHVGGNPSPVQQMMIERATRLSLALELMDERLNNDGDLSERNSRQYIALNNSLTRTLSRLGPEPEKVEKTTPMPPMSKDDIKLAATTATPVEEKKSRHTEEAGLPPGGLLRDFDAHFNRKKDKSAKARPSSAEPGSFQTHVVVR